MNAVALRFLSFLSVNTIKVKVEDFYVTVPHPANFALHKLIIFQRRLKPDKAAKDRNTAIEVLKSLIDKGESALVNQVFNPSQKSPGFSPWDECVLLFLLRRKPRTKVRGGFTSIPQKWQSKIIKGLSQRYLRRKYKMRLPEANYAKK